MSNIIILAIVASVFYLLTKNFRQNPSVLKIDLSQKQHFSGSIKDHEAGLLMALMAKVAKADGRVDELEAELIKHTLNDISNTFQNAKEVREQLKNIYKEEKEDFTNVLKIAQKYQKLTRFSYQKRLILMEHLLNLAFIDGEFSSHEQMITEDISKALELKQSDFLLIVKKLETYYAQRKSQNALNLQEAYEILGLEQTDDFSSVKKAYRKLVKKYHPDILMGQGKSQDEIQASNAKLQEINEAYELIKTKLS